MPQSRSFLRFLSRKESTPYAALFKRYDRLLKMSLLLLLSSQSRVTSLLTMSSFSDDTGLSFQFQVTRHRVFMERESHEHARTYLSTTPATSLDDADDGSFLRLSRPKIGQGDQEKKRRKVKGEEKSQKKRKTGNPGTIRGLNHLKITL